MRRFLILKILIVAMFLIAAPFTVFAAEFDGGHYLAPTAVLYSKADTSILNVLLPFKSAHTMNIEAHLMYYMYSGLLPPNVYVILASHNPGPGDLASAGDISSVTHEVMAGSAYCPIYSTLAPSEGVLTGSSEGGVLVFASLIRPTTSVFAEKGYSPGSISGTVMWAEVQECNSGGMGCYIVAEVIFADNNMLIGTASLRSMAAVFPGNQTVSPGGELAIASLIRPMANSIVV